MKRILWIFLLMLLLASQFSVTMALDPGERQIFETLETMGFDQSYVALEEEGLLIRIEDPDFKVIDSVREILLLAHDLGPVPLVTLEVYHQGEGVYAFKASGEDIAACARGEISSEAFDERIEGGSALSLESAIGHDLAVFDALVYQVALSEETVKVCLKYSGQSEEDLMMDLPNMAYRVLFHAPWVETLSFSIDHHREARALEVTFKTEDLMTLLRGETDLEGLYQKSGVSLEENSSLLDGALGTFKGLGGFLEPFREYLDFGLEMLGLLAHQFGDWVYWAVGLALLMPLLLLFKILRGIVRLFRRKKS